jgi:hypothetical protein
MDIRRDEICKFCYINYRLVERDIVPLVLSGFFQTIIVFQVINVFTFFGDKSLYPLLNSVKSQNN